MWVVNSSNGRNYGVLPTFVRWAIHGHEPVYETYSANCTNITLINFKSINSEAQYFKKIYSNPNIMRYFGHDFEKFTDK
jgi:hypothetical protein